MITRRRLVGVVVKSGEAIDGLLVTPTGNELPEVWGHWNRMAEMVGAPVIRPKGPTLDEAIASQMALPNFRMRWCTRLIKVVPLIAWAKANLKMLDRARGDDGETCRMCSM